MGSVLEALRCQGKLQSLRNSREEAILGTPGSYDGHIIYIRSLGRPSSSVPAVYKAEPWTQGTRAEAGSGDSRAGSKNEAKAEQSSMRTQRGSFRLDRGERLLEVVKRDSTCVYRGPGRAFQMEKTAGEEARVGRKSGLSGDRGRNLSKQQHPCPARIADGSGHYPPPVLARCWHLLPLLHSVSLPAWLGA